MRALIVHRNKQLGDIWRRHLARLDVEATLVNSATCAMDAIESAAFDVVVLDLVLTEGSALAVADLVRFRQPDTNVVFVTDTTFFSDGSIFQYAANARAMVKTATPPEDLAAIVHHYGISRPDRAVHHNPIPG